MIIDHSLHEPFSSSQKQRKREKESIQWCGKLFYRNIDINNILRSRRGDFLL
jgi:hypothetical protein